MIMIHKTPQAKGFKQQWTWSTELHTVQTVTDYHNGVYKVDNNLYPQTFEEIQLVKGDEKSKQEQATIN